jgi:hypothetical protein
MYTVFLKNYSQDTNCILEVIIDLVILLLINIKEDDKISKPKEDKNSFNRLLERFSRKKYFINKPLCMIRLSIPVK